MPKVAPPNKYKLIGKDYPTADLYAKVTGKAKYAEDYRVEGMLFAKLLVSTHPHARVKFDPAGNARAIEHVYDELLGLKVVPEPAERVPVAV